MKKFVLILSGVMVVCAGLGYMIGNTYSQSKFSVADYTIDFESSVQEHSIGISDLESTHWLRTKLLTSMDESGFAVIDKNSDQDVKFAQDVAKGLVGEKTSAPHTVQALKNRFDKNGYVIVKK